MTRALPVVALCFVTLSVGVGCGTGGRQPTYPTSSPPPATAQHNSPEEVRVAELIDQLADTDDRLPDRTEVQRVGRELVSVGSVAVPQLVRAVVTDTRPGVSQRCRDTLIEMGPSALPIVKAEWAKLSDRDRWKLSGVRGYHDPEFASAYVLEVLNSQDDQLVYEAMASMCQQGDMRCKKRLLELLTEKEQATLRNGGEWLRWEVIARLARIGGEDVEDAFVSLLAPDSWAAKGKGPTQYPAFPGPSETIIQQDGRRIAILWLGRMKARNAVSAMLKIVDEKGPNRLHLVRSVIFALAEIADESATDALKRISIEFAAGSQDGLTEERVAQIRLEAKKALEAIHK